jgi:hypothetical protein
MIGRASDVPWIEPKRNRPSSSGAADAGDGNIGCNCIVVPSEK